MAYVIEIPNAFEPHAIRKHRTTAGITVRGWLEKSYPGFTEFQTPTVCAVNGAYLLRAKWDRVIEEGDVVVFASHPEGPIIIIAILIIAIALTFVFMPGVTAPAVPGEAPASDPVFSTKGQENAIRLGEPIEVNYGRNRIYPSYASRPYFQYIDNDQFQHSLFCLGQGSYDIEAIQIGDTPIDDYQEVTYEVIPPGGDVTLFPTNVITSTEAGGQTLFAPNEEEYVAPGYAGPFPANPPNTTAFKVQIDVIFPKGVYWLPESGDIEDAFISFDVEAREIDNLGSPVGSFFLLGSETFTAKTTTAQRVTYEYPVSFLRVEVRLRRTSIKLLSYRAGHDIVWEGLRAYVSGIPPAWGNVTLLAVVIRATNNLNERTQGLFNAIATRMLPKFESDAMGTTLYATRSIVWAFVDAARAQYGGRLPDTYLDWDGLLTMEALFVSLGIHFDWTFRDPVTVWEVLQAIARVGRAVPILLGSLVTMKRDQFTEIPVAMFTPDNIIAGSLEWNVRLWDLDEYDSIRIEYTESATGYKQERVTCILPGGTGDNPKDIRFPGIQDRNHAYHEGLFMLAGDKKCRENITFDTGLEGYLPSYGDLIAVAHDVPRWGQFGIVLRAVLSEESGAGRYLVWVSEPLRFETTGGYQIQFRGRHGEVQGPFSAFETSSPLKVVVEMSESAFDFLEGGQNEPMMFCFGVAGQITKLLKIVKIEPQGGEVVRISSVNDAPEIYSYDELEAPELNSASVAPAAPDLPEIKALFISQLNPISAQIVQVAWTAAFGAQYYVIQTSRDGTTWTEQATTVRTAVQLQFYPGDFYVRVAAVNSGRGPWISGHEVLGFLLGLDLLLDWSEELSFKIGWQSVLTAQYRVQVWDLHESEPILRRDIITDSVVFEYDYMDADEDSNLGHRLMRVDVDTVFGGTPTGAPKSLELQNFAPSAVEDVNVVLTGIESSGVQVAYHATWTVPELNDLGRIELYLSSELDFDPIAVTPIILTPSAPGWENIPTEASFSIPLDSPGIHPTYYLRIGLFDVWGNEIVTGSGGNVSDQITIPAYP